MILLARHSVGVEPSQERLRVAVADPQGLSQGVPPGGRLRAAGQSVVVQVGGGKRVRPLLAQAASLGQSFPYRFRGGVFHPHVPGGGRLVPGQECVPGRGEPIPDPLPDRFPGVVRIRQNQDPGPRRRPPQPFPGRLADPVTAGNDHFRLHRRLDRPQIVPPFDDDDLPDPGHCPSSAGSIKTYRVSPGKIMRSCCRACCSM